ncbi:Rieske (2Fe-2S) protein [Methanoregula sp.]|jgi:nitrite reductase/ring-hydroxylating ferredoxin subunit|uniref:Rieske (2Fe-2S) protein n=1 Tax=Methanoregula sp. TaxID=2052170 RepID=UPI003C209A28
MSFFKVAKVSEIPVGTMKHVEAGGKELCIANVNGKFYAMDDRCGHENARLSRGSLMDAIATCPMHSSQFDVTTGKLMSGPVLELGGLKEMFTGCPEKVKKAVAQMFEGIAEEQRLIKTYDQQVYEVNVDGSDVLIQM